MTITDPTLMPPPLFVDGDEIHRVYGNGSATLTGRGGVDFARPQIVMEGDSPRARRSDPVTSHIAADATQAGLKEAKLRVLQLVRLHQPVAGSQLNELYRLTASRLNWKPLSFDSPRKRAGELATDGYLEVTEYAIAEGNHLPESIYALTPKGTAEVPA